MDTVIMDSLRLYRKVFSRAVFISLVITVLCTVMGIASTIFSAKLAAYTVAQAHFDFSILGFLVLLFLVGLLSFYFKATLIRVEDDISSDRVGGCCDAYRVAFLKFPTYFVASLVFLFVVMVGLVLFVIPGIYLSVLLMFFLFSILVDGDDVMASIKRSARIVWGNWWRTMIILLVVGFINAGITLAWQGLLHLGLHLEINSLTYLSLNLLPLIFTIPWGVAACLEIYYDLKLRQQGR
jgi:hypothetical protein